jgi:putative superfamily III holin-X
MQVSGRNGIAGAVNDVAEHARTLVRLEGELAALELKKKAASLGAGSAVVASGIVLGLFGFGFLLATIAAALATFLPTWLSLLIVGLVLALLAAVATALGIQELRRGAPPIPEKAIAEAKATGEALRESAHG